MSLHWPDGRLGCGLEGTFPEAWLLLGMRRHCWSSRYSCCCQSQLLLHTSWPAHISNALPFSQLLGRPYSQAWGAPVAANHLIGQALVNRSPQSRSNASCEGLYLKSWLETGWLWHPRRGRNNEFRILGAPGSTCMGLTFSCRGAILENKEDLTTLDRSPYLPFSWREVLCLPTSDFGSWWYSGKCGFWSQSGFNSSLKSDT